MKCVYMSSDSLVIYDLGAKTRSSSSTRSEERETRRRSEERRDNQRRIEESREFDEIMKRARRSSSTRSSSTRSSSRRNLTETLKARELARLASPSMTYLVKRWGYDGSGHGHSKFENETDQGKNAPWGRMLQHYTDSIFRPLAKIQQLNETVVLSYDMKPFDTRTAIFKQDRAAVQKLLKRFVNKKTRTQLRALETLCKKSNTANLQVMGRAVDLLLQMADGEFE